MTIKLKKELWVKVVQAAQAAGYSSPQEFVEHVVEREAAKIAEVKPDEEAQPDEEVVRRLKGLGYID
ncbi:MAG: hypothetical protein ACLP59_33190 [Bryobacteraceae bacterium]